MISFLQDLHFQDSTKEIEALKQEILHLLKTHELKIQFIKEEINSHRYESNSEIIAQRLLEHSHCFAHQPQAQTCA